MIHDFATAPRQSDWRADQAAVKRESKPTKVTTNKKPSKLLAGILVVSLVVLVLQWVFQSSDPQLDQQPDAAARKEYAESVLYGDADKYADLEEDSLAEPLVEGALVEDAKLREEPAKVTITATPRLEKAAVLNASKKSASKIEKVAETATVKPSQVVVEPVDPDYEFYDFLRKDSWPIPVNEGVYVDGELAQREKPIYKLQAASFRDKQDAYRLVGKLKKRKLHALVHESVSTNGEFWYQVSVGPFVNTSKLNKAQDVLVSMSMMPLKKRVR
ncbi:MAG: SPOR domain-containing protein [Pseudomonadales bacterium]|nr:SPOR domain-containing protein [Pseudomonadales bacterium]